MINSQMGHFLWNDSVDHHKYHLAKYEESESSTSRS
jgi:hypothetical protein